MTPNDTLNGTHSDAFREIKLELYRKIELHDDINELQPLAAWVEEICKENNVSDAQCMSINLALEEAVVNVVMYAYSDKTQKNTFWVDFDMDENRMSTWRIIDSGVAFDPTAQQEADITLAAEDRPIGGLGIFMIKQISESVTYERKDEKNILSLQIDLNK